MVADYDLAIVGGGINGAGIARDAAGRGLRVLLVEQNDLASGTSSASTKLIHGGLRYLEHGWFRLVREALAEREVLLRMAPHLIRPMRFVLPVEPGGCARRGMLRLGLFVYDHLGGREALAGDPQPSICCRRSARRAAAGALSQRASNIPTAMADDSRLVVLNALDAADRGATDPHPHALPARRAGRGVAARARDARTARRGDRARTDQRHRPVGSGIFNESVLQQPRARRPAPRQGQPHRGAAPVRARPRLHFPDRDGRVVFALPFERDFTLVGTTDESFTGDPGDGRAERRRKSLIFAAS